MEWNSYPVQGMYRATWDYSFMGPYGPHSIHLDTLGEPFAWQEVQPDPNNEHRRAIGLACSKLGSLMLAMYTPFTVMLSSTVIGELSDPPLVDDGGGNKAGTQVDIPANANQTPVIVMHTGEPGKHNRRRLIFPGVARRYVDGTRLSPAGITLFNTFARVLALAFSRPEIPGLFSMVLHRGGSPDLTLGTPRYVPPGWKPIRHYRVCEYLHTFRPTLL